MQSPCVGVCTIDPASGLCTGCRRSLKEIAGWSRMTDEERERIMGGLADRRTEERHTAAER